MPTYQISGPKCNLQYSLTLAALKCFRKYHAPYKTFVQYNTFKYCCHRLRHRCFTVNLLLFACFVMLLTVIYRMCILLILILQRKI